MIAGLLAPVLLSTGLLLVLLGVGAPRDERVTSLLRALTDTEVRRSTSRARTLPRAVCQRVAQIPLVRRLPDASQVSRLLRLAGRPDDVGLFLGGRVLLSVGSGLFLLLLAVAGAAPGVAVLAPVAAVGAYLVPGILLGREARRRQEAVSRQVPDLVELLLAAAEAGAGLPASLERAKSMTRPPLGPELLRASRRVELGESWREALERTAEDVDSEPLRRFVRTMARSQRLGTSIRASLRSMAEDLRVEQRDRAAESAHRAPVKMLFPLVFMILPAFLLLTVGPVLLATLRSLQG